MTKGIGIIKGCTHHVSATNLDNWVKMKTERLGIKDEMKQN